MAGTGAAVISALWLICLGLSLTGMGRRQRLGLGIAASLIVLTTFAFAGVNARRLLESQPLFARVSLRAGIWICLAGAYCLIFTARQRLSGARIQQNLISWVGVAGVGSLLITGWLNDLSILQEFTGYAGRFFQELKQHVFLAGTSIGIGGLLGILLGIWAAKSKRAEKPIFYFANITQTIPSLALFGLLIAPLSALSLALPTLRELGIRGIGAAPAAMLALLVDQLLENIETIFAYPG